jgi:hypothetical protein
MYGVAGSAQAVVWEIDVYLTDKQPVIRLVFGWRPRRRRLSHGGFDEQIVREYFELHGFLVRQWRKYQTPPRKKLPEEEIDLLVHNPMYTGGERAPDFMHVLQRVTLRAAGGRGSSAESMATPRSVSPRA